MGGMVFPGGVYTWHGAQRNVLVITMYQPGLRGGVIYFFCFLKNFWTFSNTQPHSPARWSSLAMSTFIWMMQTIHTRFISTWFSNSSVSFSMSIRSLTIVMSSCTIHLCQTPCSYECFVVQFTLPDRETENMAAGYMYRRKKYEESFKAWGSQSSTYNSYFENNAQNTGHYIRIWKILQHPSQKLGCFSTKATSDCKFSPDEFANFFQNKLSKIRPRSDLGGNLAWPSLAPGSVSYSIQAQLHHEQLPGWPCTRVLDRAMPLRDWHSSKVQPSVVVPGSTPDPSKSKGTIRSCGNYFLPTSDFSTTTINFSGRD